MITPPAVALDVETHQPERLPDAVAVALPPAPPAAGSRAWIVVLLALAVVGLALVCYALTH